MRFRTLISQSFSSGLQMPVHLRSFCPWKNTILEALKFSGISAFADGAQNNLKTTLLKSPKNHRTKIIYGLASEILHKFPAYHYHNPEPLTIIQALSNTLIDISSNSS